jgi:hypothetical protein
MVNKGLIRPCQKPPPVKSICCRKTRPFRPSAARLRQPSSALPARSILLARRLLPVPRSSARRPQSQGGPSDECMSGFVPLREEAEKAWQDDSASVRHASPDKACKLIKAFSHAEIKMIKYVESLAAKCGITPQISTSESWATTTPKA